MIVPNLNGATALNAATCIVWHGHSLQYALLNSLLDQLKDSFCWGSDSRFCTSVWLLLDYRILVVVRLRVVRKPEHELQAEVKASCQ